MKSEERIIKEVEDKLDGITKLGCSYCIQERITESMYDRFGTTEQQEIEAKCDKHLLEAINLYTKMAETFELALHQIKLIAEKERRGI